MELECIEKKSYIWIAVNTTSVTASVITAVFASVELAAALQKLKSEDDILSGILSKVQTLTICLTVLSKEKIAKRLHNKFKPINIY